MTSKEQNLEFEIARSPLGVDVQINPRACQLAPPDRYPAHDFIPFKSDDAFTERFKMLCRQCGEMR